MQKTNIVFSALVVKAYMYVMEGLKSIESFQLTICMSLKTPFKLNQNTIFHADAGQYPLYCLTKMHDNEEEYLKLWTSPSRMPCNHIGME